jgi:hypothetical protein
MGHEACVGRIRSICSFGQKPKRRAHLRPRRRQGETLKWIFSRNLWDVWVVGYVWTGLTWAYMNT